MQTMNTAPARRQAMAAGAPAMPARPLPATPAPAVCGRVKPIEGFDRGEKGGKV